MGTSSEGQWEEGHTHSFYVRNKSCTLVQMMYISSRPVCTILPPTTMRFPLFICKWKWYTFKAYNAATGYTRTLWNDSCGPFLPWRENEALLFPLVPASQHTAVDPRASCRRPVQTGWLSAAVFSSTIWALLQLLVAIRMCCVQRLGCWLNQLKDQLVQCKCLEK